jgi:uncharacterized phage-associated protein
MMSANDVASVILARAGSWTDAEKLQKLLYYVQAWHLAVTNEPLFSEQIKAWKDGPVVPQVWHSRQEKATRLAAKQHVEDIQLDEMTSDLIDLVLVNYGSMTGDQLSALTHVEEPWRSARGDLPDDAECRDPISTEQMATFYRSHRLLGGSTAADLAAGGIHLRDHGASGPVDVDFLLASLSADLDDPGDDLWGGASLEDSNQYDSTGIIEQRGRAYTD